MSWQVRLLISIGLILDTSMGFLHTQFPAIPDFIIGSLMGLGIGMTFAGLIRQKRIGGACGRKEGVVKQN